MLQTHHLDELVALDTLTGQVARFLEVAVAAGLNILVSGGTEAGKATLLNCLCAAIPARERVITCGEVFEFPQPPSQARSLAMTITLWAAVGWGRIEPAAVWRHRRISASDLGP